MFTGTVKKYFVDKGYGFISRDDGGDDSYIHITKCNDTESLNEGDKVSFDDIEYWSKSKQYMKMDAINCTVIATGGGGGGEQGTVKMWREDKGFGFITPDDGGDDVFIHKKKCNGAESLNAGDKVSFDMGEYWSESKQYMKVEANNCTVFASGGGGGGGEGTMTGTVRMWREDKGFGFITPDDGGDDVFIHKTQCNDTESLSEGDQVSFDRDAPHWSKKKERYFRDGSNCTVIRGGPGRPIRKWCGQSVEDLI